MTKEMKYPLPAYNTRREQLIMPEYGRTIQDMVDVALQIEDREERNRCASYIVSVMARMQNENASRPDFQHLLWNHLAKMSHYKLDVDYPVDIVPEEQALAHPAPLPYPMKRIQRKHYGYLVEQMLDFITKEEDAQTRMDMTTVVANQMRQDLYSWNRDSLDEDLILQDILRYTRGKGRLPQAFRFAPIVQPEVQYASGKNRKKK